MEEYRIVSVTDLSGYDREDGRYPLRVGQICTKPFAAEGYNMVIHYLRNRDGSDYSNKCLWTSRVSKVIYRNNGDIVVYTKHTIYTFEKVVD